MVAHRGPQKEAMEGEKWLDSGHILEVDPNANCMEKQVMPTVSSHVWRQQSMASPIAQGLGQQREFAVGGGKEHSCSGDCGLIY